MAAWIQRGPAAGLGRTLHRGLIRGHLSKAEVGALGEELAARVLVDSGLRCIGRNVRAPEAEIDIVAREGGVLVVVEVKTGWCPADRRATGPDRGRWARPAARVRPDDVARRLRAARRMIGGSLPWAQSCRYDLLEVLVGRGPGGLEVIHHRGITPWALWSVVGPDVVPGTGSTAAGRP